MGGHLVGLLRWNVGNEDSIILICNEYWLIRVGKTKQVGERQPVHQGPNMFYDVMQLVKRIFHNCGIDLKVLSHNSNLYGITFHDIS